MLANTVAYWVAQNGCNPSANQRLPFATENQDQLAAQGKSIERSTNEGRPDLGERQSPGKTPM
jgi:hypothetical protein